MKRLNIIFFVCILLKGYEAVDIEFATYNETRNDILEKEYSLITGGRLHLNEKELKVEELFLKYKQEELQNGVEQPENNAPAMHFFKAKSLIEKSKIFQLLQIMPKGANLHLHHLASVSCKWIVQKLLNMENLLRCVNTNGVNILTFRKSKLHNCATQYFNVHEERLNATSTASYDASFEQLINLWTPEPEIKYKSLHSVWEVFKNMFVTIGDALSYLPFYRDYQYQLLKEMYNDNIMYAELRMSQRNNRGKLYDQYGNTYAAQQAVQEIINIVEAFKTEHPDFLGVKAIYSTRRRYTDDEIRLEIEMYNYFQKLFPDFIIGFDLDGRENEGRTFYSLLSVLSELPKSTSLFLHAGETNLYGSSTDFNILDALLINTTRIGHGYGIAKHPILAKAVKRRKIAIEVSPISNQVLNLVSDLHNHPASMFVAYNIPFVICSDDPTFWNSQGLSYDFYYAIMSIAPNYSGLKTLKALVWNSIKYSVLTKIERKQAFGILNKQWNEFINKALLN